MFNQAFWGYWYGNSGWIIGFSIDVMATINT
jgi:hypothetical protein